MTRAPIAGHGAWAVARLGFRGAAFRPGRSVLSAALVASAAFIIVSVDAFRRGGGELTQDPRSGTGGFVLLAESEVPIVHNPNEASGREALLVRAPELQRARFSRFRLRPGEDASCLNLYRPGNPTIIAPERSFVEAGRFTFSGSLAENDAEKANPWLLLQRTFEDGTVPVIADATSLQYVLHASLGDTMSIDVGGEPAARAALRRRAARQRAAGRAGHGGAGVRARVPGRAGLPVLPDRGARRAHHRSRRVRSPRSWSASWTRSASTP